MTDWPRESVIKFSSAGLLTSLVQIEGFVKDIDKRVFALVTVGALVVVHVKGPHHGTPKVVLFQPLNLHKRAYCE